MDAPEELVYFRSFFYGLIDAAVPEDELNSIRRAMENKETSELYDELSTVDPTRAKELSANDRVRISRALEVYLSTGKTLTRHRDDQTGQDARELGGDLRIVITLPRSVLRERIAVRTKDMYHSGWVQEVDGLLGSGWTLETPAMNSLGYSVIAQAILGGGDPQKTLARVTTLTQQYAKRQETFFRSIPEAHWINAGEEGVVDNIKNLIKKWGRL